MNILIGHLVGDFLLQNRWLAAKKTHKWYAILLHCLLVTIAFYLFNFWSIWQMIVVFSSHFLIDALGIGKKYPDWIKQGTPGSDEPAPLWLRILSDSTMHLMAYYLIGKYLS